MQIVFWKNYAVHVTSCLEGESNEEVGQAMSDASGGRGVSTWEEAKERKVDLAVRKNFLNTGETMPGKHYAIFLPVTNSPFCYILCSHYISSQTP